mmetsp:Transcript_59633/g.169009  ORF Transcript_59633/g.169009 Transcript_59633/m.169009 type:complete len:124 (-) Transcript_59633:690-1061(-)
MLQQPLLLYCSAHSEIRGFMRLVAPVMTGAARAQWRRLPLSTSSSSWSSSDVDHIRGACPRSRYSYQWRWGSAEAFRRPLPRLLQGKLFRSMIGKRFEPKKGTGQDQLMDCPARTCQPKRAQK